MTKRALGTAARGSSARTSTAALDQVSYRNVRRTFRQGRNDFVAVDGINLDVGCGTFVSIIGPSGCGKSTLLNLVAGLIRPTSGEVFYDGVAVRGVNPNVGYVTQHDTLLPWRTVERNVGLALELAGVSRGERRERVGQMLSRVGLAGFARHYPAQLSGGMRKRVALARTFIHEPATLIMDEPFGALDAQSRMSLQRQLLSLWDGAKTVLFVTHDLEEAILLADKVVVFSAAPGRIIHVEDVGLPRPRDLVGLRSDPLFAAMWDRLWKLLEPSAGR